MTPPELFPVPRPPVRHQCAPGGGGCRAQVEVRDHGSNSEQTYYVPGGCLHAHTTPVDTLTGDVVATLCLCCDRQLPAHWQPGSVNWMRTERIR